MDSSTRDLDIKLTGLSFHKIKICSKMILKNLREDCIMKNRIGEDG